MSIDVADIPYSDKAIYYIIDLKLFILYFSYVSMKLVLKIAKLGLFTNIFDNLRVYWYK